MGEKRLKHGSKKDFQEQSKDEPPSRSAARLKPFIERGIANGIFQDDSSVVAMFKAKASDPTLKETLSSLGGLKSEIGQAFITDIVLTDLTSILRQKRYTAHMKVWEVSHNTVGLLQATQEVCATSLTKSLLKMVMKRWIPHCSPCRYGIAKRPLATMLSVMEFIPLRFHAKINNLVLDLKPLVWIDEVCTGRIRPC